MSQAAPSWQWGSDPGEVVQPEIYKSLSLPPSQAAGWNLLQRRLLSEDIGIAVGYDEGNKSRENSCNKVIRTQMESGHKFWFTMRCFMNLCGWQNQS